jgi:phosphoserine aminotransferase
VLFLQGGATQQFAQIPMNLLAGRSADYVVTGSWSKKAYKEAQRGQRALAGSTESDGSPPAGGRRAEARPAGCLSARLHQRNHPRCRDVRPARSAGGVPLVADMSSHILSRPMDVSRYGLIYAGAQKNIGPAGLSSSSCVKTCSARPCRARPA